MRPIVFFVATLASHGLAAEPVKGLNELDKRQTTNYCGMDGKLKSFLWIGLTSPLGGGGWST